jgi:hypothetical protein
VCSILYFIILLSLSFIIYSYDRNPLLSYTCGCLSGYDNNPISGACEPICGDGQVVSGEVCDSPNNTKGPGMIFKVDFM